MILKRQITRRLLFIITTFILLGGLLFLQVGQHPTVKHSMISKNPEGYELELSITLNKIFVFDRKSVEHLLIQKTLNNDFENVHFSYDIQGLPQKIKMTVYANALTYILNTPSFVLQQELKE